MERRIIFLDIDGTLTEPGRNEPPESAAEAVRLARERGHCVFLCTGRNYDMLLPLLNYGFDGVVASSGGYIEFGRAILYDCPMTGKQQERAMRILRERGIYCTVECMDGSYTDEGFKEYLRAHASQAGYSDLLRWREQIEESLHIRPMREYRGQPVYKIVVMSPSKEAFTEAGELLAADFDLCIQEENRNGFTGAEIVNRQFDKGRAVKRVCEYLGVPLNASVAIGDSMNDKEMLETAGLSICMGNGSEALKRLADDVCPSVREDGIYHAFRKHQLI